MTTHHNDFEDEVACQQVYRQTFVSSEILQKLQKVESDRDKQIENRASAFRLDGRTKSAVESPNRDAFVTKSSSRLAMNTIVNSMMADCLADH